MNAIHGRKVEIAAGLDVPAALVQVPLLPPPASVDEAEAAVAHVLAAVPRPAAGRTGESFAGAQRRSAFTSTHG